MAVRGEIEGRWGRGDAQHAALRIALSPILDERIAAGGQVGGQGARRDFA
jgi:hypothetical protein